MKVLGASAVVGTLIALLIIYWLRPLNPGAVALVLILSIGLVALLGRLLSWLLMTATEKKGDSE